MAAKQSKQPNSEAANEKDKAHPAPVTVIEATPVSHETHDGFDSPDEGGSDSILKGEKLKFTRGATWIDRSETVIDPKREFIVAEVKKVIQKWIPDVERPETTELGPDEFFPDIEKMNAEAPQSEWREVFGKSEGPYQKAYVVYLFDPRTMEAFTFITATKGGFRATDELKGKVRRARELKGTNRFALVTLGDSIMPSRLYGEIPCPDFKIIDFVPLGGPTQPLIEPAKPTVAEELNDEIPDFSKPRKAQG
jgi:hypothetical protein